LQKILYVIILS